MTFVYPVILAAMAVLIIVSNRYVDSDETGGRTGITRMFYVSALFLCRKIRTVSSKKGRAAKHTESVRTALTLTGNGGRDAGEEWQATGISRVLCILTAGTLLAFIVNISPHKNTVLSEEGTIERGTYGAFPVTSTLKASTADGDERGTFSVDIESVHYTKEEADKLFEEAALLLPEAVKGDNASIDDVTSDLKTVKSLPGYPFQITWETDDFRHIRSDGAVNTEDLGDESAVVPFTAVCTYDGNEWRKTYYVTVHAAVPDAETMRRNEIMKAVDEAQEDGLYETVMTLPKEVGGESLVWEEVVSDSSGVLFALALAAAVMVYFAHDRELQNSFQKRQESLSCAYPSFVSKLTLYMGAGMTVRSIFLKTAADYKKKRAEGEEPLVLDEELVRTANELSNGVSETVAYERFSKRCRIQEYTKLVALLTQNLKKGSTGLLPLLKEEAGHAVNERLDRARVKGEQASTKLMLPMMLMLVVVMVLVMVPAYLSF